MRLRITLVSMGRGLLILLSGVAAATPAEAFLSGTGDPVVVQIDPTPEAEWTRMVFQLGYRMSSPNYPPADPGVFTQANWSFASCRARSSFPRLAPVSRSAGLQSAFEMQMTCTQNIFKGMYDGSVGLVADACRYVGTRSANPGLLASDLRSVAGLVDELTFTYVQAVLEPDVLAARVAKKCSRTVTDVSQLSESELIQLAGEFCRKVSSFVTTGVATGGVVGLGSAISGRLMTAVRAGAGSGEQTALLAQFRSFVKASASDTSGLYVPKDVAYRNPSSFLGSTSNVGAAFEGALSEAQQLALRQTAEKLAQNPELFGGNLWVTGSNSATFVGLAKTEGTLLPTGQLMNQGIVPFGGEMRAGASLTGNNVAQLSGVGVENLSTAMTYASRAAFSWDEARRSLQYLLQQARQISSSRFDTVLEGGGVGLIRQMRVWDASRFASEFPTLAQDFQALAGAGASASRVAALQRATSVISENLPMILSAADRQLVEGSFGVVFGSRTLSGTPLAGGLPGELGVSQAVLGRDIQYVFTDAANFNAANQWLRTNNIQGVKVLGMDLLDGLRRVASTPAMRGAAGNSSAWGTALGQLKEYLGALGAARCR